MKFFRRHNTDSQPPKSAAPRTTASAPNPELAPSNRQRATPKPSRFTFSAFGGMRTTRTNGGPLRADVDGTRHDGEVSAKPMSAARSAAAVERSRAAVARLRPVSEPEKGLPTTPDTVAGMRDEAGFRQAVHGMFGDVAASPELANLILGAVPPAAEGESPYANPLMVATALRSVGVTNLEDAQGLLIASTRGEHPLHTLDTDEQGRTQRRTVPVDVDAQLEERHGRFEPKYDRQLFQLERVMASTMQGTRALAQLRHMDDDPQKLELMRDSLRLCSALEDKGLDMAEHTSPESVLKHLLDAESHKMEQPIGKDDDAPLQLLAKALSHVDDLRNGDEPSPSDRAAYAAWKQGNFTQSGKGTPFNKTIERLHKFLTYVDRADHGPRTAANMAHDAKAWLGRMVGVGKSPLTPTRHVLQGTDRGLVHQEVEKFQAKLNETLATAVDVLVDELKDTAADTDPAKHNKLLAQAAVLDVWRETGDRKLSPAAVYKRAGEIRSELDEAAVGVNKSAMQPHIKRMTHASRDDAGEPALLVNVRTLEAAGAARGRKGRSSAAGAAPTDPEVLRTRIEACRARLVREPGHADARQELSRLQGQRRAAVSSLVDDLRSIDEARVDQKPLFKFSDLKRLVRGTPREGPTAADAHKLMSEIATAPYESKSTFADGASGGAGLSGALLLGAGAVTGTPIVYPVLYGEKGRRARVTVGVGNTGCHLYVGSEKTRFATAGAGAGWASPALAHHLIGAGAVADVSAYHSGGTAEGARIVARPDRPGWKEKMPKVIDFMFEQASLPDHSGDVRRPQTASELWQRYSDRFGDDPNLNVHWEDETRSTTGAQANATAVARVIVGNTRIGPAVSAGVQAQGTRREWHLHGEAAGQVTIDRTVTGRAAVALTQTLPAVISSTPSQHAGAVNGWGTQVPLMEAAWQFDVAGSVGEARLLHDRNGELTPKLCHREVLFQNPQRLVEYVNLHRADWEAAIVAQDPNGATTPEMARDRLNTFLQQEAALPAADSSLHGEQRNLSKAVADQINQLQARLDTLRGAGASAARARTLSAAEKAECKAIENEVQRLLTSEKSWVPDSLYGVEFNHTSSSTGLNAGLRIVNNEEATIPRLTTALVASMAKL